MIMLFISLHMDAFLHPEGQESITFLFLRPTFKFSKRQTKEQVIQALNDIISG
jgi:hypothetical protein